MALERRLDAGALWLRDGVAELDAAVAEVDPARFVIVNTPAYLQAVVRRRDGDVG
jgi:hypothetical protein